MHQTIGGKYFFLICELTQAFCTELVPGYNYLNTITEDNLVERINFMMRVYQRQRDRISDLMDGMKRLLPWNETYNYGQKKVARWN